MADKYKYLHSPVIEKIGNMDVITFPRPYVEIMRKDPAKLLPNEAKYVRHINAQVAQKLAEVPGYEHWDDSMPLSTYPGHAHMDRLHSAYAPINRGRFKPFLDYYASPEGLARFAMASAFMVENFANLSTALNNALTNPVGGAVPIGTPGIPANSLPEGVEFSEGPCQNWGSDGNPVGMMEGAITPCFQVTRALAQATDSAISSALSSGQTVFLNYNRLGNIWRNYAWVSNPLAPSDVIWNSQIHGKAVPQPATGATTATQIQNRFETLLQALGESMQPMPNFEQMFQNVPGNDLLPGTMNRWWTNPGMVPIVNGNVVGFPDFMGGNNTGVGVVVQPNPNPNTNNPPQWRPEPDTKPFAGGRGFRHHSGNLVTTNGYRDKPGRNQRERKGGLSKALSFALDFAGALSEIGDDIDSFYKSLPASTRRLLRKRNGKALTWDQKAQAIYYFWDQIDLEVAVAGMITSRIDDMVVGMMHAPFDKALQKVVPDYLTRQLVRQGIRWAYWKLDMESPIPRPPSSQAWLPERYRQVPEWKDRYKKGDQYVLY